MWTTPAPSRFLGPVAVREWAAVAVAAKPFQVVDAFFGQRFLRDSSQIWVNLITTEPESDPALGMMVRNREIIPIWPQFIQVSEIL